MFKLDAMAVNTKHSNDPYQAVKLTSIAQLLQSLLRYFGHLQDTPYGSKLSVHTNGFRHSRPYEPKTYMAVSKIILLDENRYYG